MEVFIPGKRRKPGVCVPLFNSFERLQAGLNNNRMQPRIVIFDDEETLGEIIKFSLQKKGVEVFSCQDCNNLDATIDEIMPQVILMDNKIPPRGGIEAVQSIKRNPKYNHIPVIYFSAHEEIERLAQEAGADDHFAKPFKIDTLEKVVMRYIEVFHQRSNLS